VHFATLRYRTISEFPRQLYQFSIAGFANPVAIASSLGSYLLGTEKQKSGMISIWMPENSGIAAKKGKKRYKGAQFRRAIFVKASPVDV